MSRSRIDLHAHSSVSDGTQPPAEVVASAKDAGLTTLALTDHDTTAGWSEAAEAALTHDIDLVPGIEISTSTEGVSIHLLGYLIDPDHAPLVRELEAAVASRRDRLVTMVERLREGGVPVNLEEVRAQIRPGATLGRPHIADALVASGFVRDRTEAFEGVLHSTSPYYVRHYTIDTAQAVRLVREAGGVPVMAHPFASRRGRIVDDAVIAGLVDAGLLGIEAHHRDHSPEEVERTLRLAREHDLLVTGSSDYHGAGKPNRLGEHTTDPEVLARIEDLATSSTRVVRG